MNIGDIDKKLYRLKIIPNINPNDEGFWDYYEVHPRHVNPKIDWEYLSSLVPSGHHIVAIEEVGKNE